MKNLEGSMSQLLESREKKIKTLEATLKEIKHENISLQHEVEVLKLKVSSQILTIRSVFPND
jgi:16S rRNA G527 N7-methylase RsmG